MKAAVVWEVGKSPVYSEFEEPILHEDEALDGVPRGRRLPHRPSTRPDKTARQLPIERRPSRMGATP